MKEILYGFYYNEMTEESAYALMSLHRSKENAEKAMNAHRANALIEYNDRVGMMVQEYGDDYPVSDFGKWEDWMVCEIEVLP